MVGRLSPANSEQTLAPAAAALLAIRAWPDPRLALTTRPSPGRCACSAGAGQGAGAAQGLWGPSTTGRGQHDLDRVLGVGLPGGMDGHRPGPRPGPDPVADHFATEQQRGRGSALVARPGALGEQ